MQRYALVVFMLLLAVSTTARGEQGKILGEVSYTLPSWFKESFLEIREDVDEARQQDKHVMLFMHIDRCPYCTRMIQEDFARSELVEYIQANFDVIALNIRGDREVAWDENTRYSEKELAKSLGVQYTPTIVFLDARGEKVYQMHGYRKPAAFGQLLHYIAERQYETVSLVDYLRQQEAIRYTFRDQPLFTATTDLSAYQGPLAVIFEDRGCVDCDEFHDEVLAHPVVVPELERFTVVRLDADSTDPLIDPAGKPTTPREMAQALRLDFRPGTVLYDGGREIARADGRLYHFHFTELLRYVANGEYHRYPTFLEYLAVRQREILSSGKDIDFGK